MISTLISTLPFLLTLANAFPSTLTNAQPLDTRASGNPTNFLLVTTTSRHPAPNGNSSLLPSVSATSLFDPYYQANFLLRTIDPGYLSLPTFTLTDGTLHTISSGPHGIGTYMYNSTKQLEGTDLQFYALEEADGNLGLEKGRLLTVDGKSEGWTLCDGELEQTVVSNHINSFVWAQVSKESKLVLFIFFFLPFSPLCYFGFICFG
jgi:hypothetical protein